MAASNPPTLQAIADRVGVSVSTVSRTLSGKGDRYRISEQTQRKVRRVAQQLNFAPNELAVSLRLKRTKTLGLVIPDIANPFFARIARRVTVEARERGYTIILCDSQDQTELEMQSLELLRQRQVEGLLLCPVGCTGEHLEQLRQSGLPFVLLDRYFPQYDLPSVASDNLGGARAAAEHLLQHGHRKIACLKGVDGTSTNEDRLAGYRAALEHHKLPFDERLVAGEDFSGESGYRAMRRLLDSQIDFTAVFALGNLIALGALRALREAELRIPEDVSLVGFDDHPYADFLATPMTTVSQDCDALGHRALACLFGQIGGSQPSGAKPQRVATRLISRSSVRRLP